MSPPPLTFPQITPRPGGFEYFWAPGDFYIRLEYLREHHDSITAEIWAEQGEAREHLIGGLRYNLVSPGGRASIAKALGARRNGVDWGGMIEQVCVYALGKFREQEALTHIGDQQIGTELKFRLSPVVPQGTTTLLFGYGGLAKTTIAYAWGLLVQTGTAQLGLTPTPGPVMVLDWETDVNIANRVQQFLHIGLGLPELPHFLYRKCRRPFGEFVEQAKADVEREGVALTIADSLAMACGSEKELKENVIPTLSALGQLGTVIVISHRPKGELGRERGTYGSIYAENNVRQSFRVEGQEGPEKNELHVALFHSKHNLMSLLQPIGYHITWDNLLGTKIEREDIGSVDGLKERLTTIQRIEHALRTLKPKMTAEELAKATTLKEDTIKKTLQRQEGKRFVVVGEEITGGRPATLWGLKATDVPEQFK